MRESGVKIRVGTKKILGRQNTVPRKLHAFGAQKIIICPSPEKTQWA